MNISDSDTEESSRPDRIWSELAVLQEELSRQKLSLEAANEEARRFRNILQKADAAVIGLNAEGVVLFAEGRGLSKLSLVPGEIIGRSALEIFRDQPATLDCMRRANMGESSRGTLVANALTFEALFWPYYDVQERFAGTAGVLIDVSERRRTEHLLREREALFELMPSGLLLLNAEGVVLDANPTLCKQLGYSRREMLGMHISRFSQESAATIENNIAQVLAGSLLEHEVTNVQKDGSLRHYELRETVITLPDGSRAILVMSDDITELLKASQAKLELERHLLHAEKLKSLGVLAGGIAHDFNNLLTVTLGNLELAMLDLPQDLAVLSKLSAATAAARRAADLTRQIQAYAGDGHFSVQPRDLSELVRGMSELLRAAISMNVSLEMHLAPDLPIVDVDPTQLQQVLLNLLTNASEAIGSEPGTISITTAARECDAAYLAQNRLENQPVAGRYAILEVRDTGCGMDEFVQERLFDPFFTTKFTGRGLGMSSVMGVVRGHGGAIFVESYPGKGSTIRVMFPAQADEPAREKQSAADSSANDIPNAPALTGIVLVVDDEDPVRALAEEVLSRTGLRVLSVADGEAAVELFKRHAHEIRFVLLDLTMPKMDGLRTFAELRRHQPDVKAILTSGHDLGVMEHRYSNQGFEAFLQKPYDVEELIRLAQRLCRSSR